jgi:hypothetical protein
MLALHRQSVSQEHERQPRAAGVGAFGDLAASDGPSRNSSSSECKGVAVHRDGKPLDRVAAVCL